MAIRPLIDEHELLRAVASGDQRAFKKIYDHYHENVYAFSLWYLKSEADAEEVVQETFLKLWMKGTAVTDIANLQKYLRTLAGNKSLDMLRYQARRLKTVVLTDDEDTEPGHNETEEGILLNDVRQILQEAIEQLPVQQKLVYRLCNEQGLKNDEVAQQLNLSPLTVRTHMKLALRFLRAYISAHMDKVAVLSLMAVLKIF